MALCPRCGFEAGGGADCPRCGVVFSKLRGAELRGGEGDRARAGRSRGGSPESMLAPGTPLCALLHMEEALAGAIGLSLFTMVKKKAAPVPTTYARSSAALVHGANAAGARFIRRGFAFTADADLEFALGSPALPGVARRPPRDERAAEIAKSKILGWVARWVPWSAAPGGIRLERFRPSPFVLELEDPTARPHRRYCFRTPDTCGFYDTLPEGTFALFRFRGLLYFRADDRVLPIAPDVTCEWTDGPEDHNRFVLRHHAETWLDRSYLVPMDKLDCADLNFESSRNDFLRWVFYALDLGRRDDVFAGPSREPWRGGVRSWLALAALVTQ